MFLTQSVQLQIVLPYLISAKSLVVGAINITFPVFSNISWSENTSAVKLAISHQKPQKDSP
ncbi:MAG: hypothetical protein AB8V06_08380 [Francisella endosymbiont of Hyalomma asiaticum]